MAESTFRHSDDDGALSIFVSGSGKDAEILFVCENRHWWTVSAADGGSATKAAAKRAIDGVVPKKAMAKADKQLADLSAKFGPGVYKAMRSR